MKNKFISFVLVFAMLIVAALPLAGCGNKDFPVEVANIVIKEKPENIVVLDAPTADIVSYMGYLDIVGKSDDVDQKWLGVVPSVGAANSPDVKKIINSKADIVFASENLDDTAKTALEEADIQVITMSHAQTPNQLETNYLTIAKILWGKETGQSTGTKSYADLLNSFDTIKKEADGAKTTDVPETVCYLYYENGKLKMMSSGTYGDMLLSYTNAVNAAVNIDDNLVDVNTLKIANPNYIFYADEETLKQIKANAALRTLNAVKNNKTLMVSAEEMERQGQTAVDTLQKMVYFIYPQLKPADKTSTPDQAAATAATQPTVSATVASAEATTSTSPTASQNRGSVAAQYKINITPTLSLKLEDENNNVKAMQQRLFDLGYVTDDGNITGYYGEVSQKAVREFQKKNGIAQTGIADNATLTAMFNSGAVKAN